MPQTNEAPERANARGSVSQINSRDLDTPKASESQGNSYEIRKNAREILVPELAEFKGKKFLSLRMWYRPRDGEELRPGKDGVTLPPNKICELIAALQVIEMQARERGLIEVGQ